MVWVDPMFSVDFWVNRYCVWCSINCCGDMVRSTLVGVDGGLGSMGLRPN